MPSAEERAIRRVWCPFCGAPPTTPCRKPTGRKVYAHQVRVELARLRGYLPVLDDPREKRW